MGNTQSNSEKENNQVNGGEKSQSIELEKGNSGEFLAYFMSCCGSANKRNLEVSNINKKSKIHKNQIKLNGKKYDNFEESKFEEDEKKKIINGFNNCNLKDEHEKLDSNSALNEENIQIDAIDIIIGNFVLKIIKIF